YADFLKKHRSIVWKKYLDEEKLYILGANFGPVNSEEFITFYDDIFKKANDVCFRDVTSCKYFPNNPKVRSSSDIVFSLKVPTVRKIDKTVGISVMDLSKKSDLNKFSSSFRENLSTFIRSLLSQGYHITLFSFCEPEGDMVEISKILEGLDSKENIDFVNYVGNIDEFL
ncbi:TPA: polysaccharide pyruvyl transferase family protein, partial [Streptococcus suis]